MLLLILICVAVLSLAQTEVRAADAVGVRNLLAAEELARGKPYTERDRQKRAIELENTLARIGTRGDPLRLEALRLIDQGNVADAKAKLQELPVGDEKALAEAERAIGEQRVLAARSARDLAVPMRGADLSKAVMYFERAARHDPTDPEIWFDYGEAARYAGRSTEALSAFVESARRAHERADPLTLSKATYRQGDLAVDKGDLLAARTLFEAALATIQPSASPIPAMPTGNVSFLHHT